MSQFPLFETLLIKDGIPQNIAYHQQRFNLACREFFKVDPFLNLIEVIIPPIMNCDEILRCRLDYNQSDYQVNFFTYKPKQITEFQVIETQQLDYQFKYRDRTFFQSLPTNEQREVIIVNNGKVSDCTIGNLLFLKQGKWFSPQDYLLKGTQLSRLLDEKQVELCEITPNNLTNFEQVMLINALNPFDPARAIPIQAVRF